MVVTLRGAAKLETSAETAARARLVSAQERVTCSHRTLPLSEIRMSSLTVESRR